jgi:hypothetical protein
MATPESTPSIRSGNPIPVRVHLDAELRFLIADNPDLGTVEVEVLGSIRST